MTWPTDAELVEGMAQFGARLRAADLNARLGIALHAALDDELGCRQTHLDASSTAVTHELADLWWAQVARDVQTYVVARQHDTLPESVLANLRSHSFPHCEACGAAIDEPEATAYCEWDPLDEMAGPAPTGAATDVAGLGPDQASVPEHRYRPCAKCGRAPDVHNGNRPDFAGHEYA